MLKHIITTKCNKNCSYCITKNVKNKDFNFDNDCDKVMPLYHKLSKEHKQIVITGGEPTEHNNWYAFLTYASMAFKEVCITTQNESVLSNSIVPLAAKSIVFSIHNQDFKKFKINIDIPVYAAILAEQYIPGMEKVLKKNGFSGLTINEEQRNGKSFTKKINPLKGFSIKSNSSTTQISLPFPPTTSDSRR